MKKRQWIALLIAALMSQGVCAMAQEVKTESKNMIVEAFEAKNNYITKVGKITEINEENGRYKILIGEPVEGIQFIVDNSQVIIDATTLTYLQVSELKVGMEITVVLPKNAPMTMSLPAIISGQTAIIINSAERSIELSYFNEVLVNEENTLALNIDRGTYITNTIGERRIFTQEDIQNHSAVVIYTLATYSIPAQTTPDMVLILPTNSKAVEEEVNDVKEKIVSTQKEKTQYVKIREMAEAKGYTVVWDQLNKSVTLTKEENTIILIVGKAQFTHNRTTKQLEDIVKMDSGKVVVSSDIVECIQ